MRRQKPKASKNKPTNSTKLGADLTEPTDAAFVLYRDALLFRVREAYPNLSDKQFIKEIIQGWLNMPPNEHALWRDASALAKSEQDKLLQHSAPQPPLPGQEPEPEPQRWTDLNGGPVSEMSNLRIQPSPSSSAQPWVTQASSVAGPSRPPLSRTPSPSRQPLVAIPLPPGSCTASPHLNRRRRLAGVETVNENTGGSKGKGKAKARVLSAGDRRSRLDPDGSSGAGRACLAIDRWDDKCEALVVGGAEDQAGSVFCGVHQAEEAVIRAEYERKQFDTRPFPFA